MSTHLLASERNTRERIFPRSTYGFRDSAPWSAMKEKRRNMNKCISPAALLCAAREKRGVHREKRHPRTRAYASSATMDKTLFPGENTRGMGATIRALQSSSRKMHVGRNGRCAYTRKLRYPPAVAMNFDRSFSPPRSFRPERRWFALCNLCARIVSRYILRERRLFLSLTLLPYILFIIASIHGPSRAIVCVPNMRCFKLKR